MRGPIIAAMAGLAAVLAACAQDAATRPAGAVVASAPGRSATRAATSSAAPASQPATTRASVARLPRRPTTLPALATMPAVDAKRVAALVSGLSADKYQQRRSAQTELENMVNLPGVVELLRAALEKADDLEAKTALESLVAGHDQPVAMLWCRGQGLKIAAGVQHMRRDVGYPWVFVSGDGSFLIEAGCPFVTAQPDDQRIRDFRRGKLSPQQLWALKEMILRSGLARQAPKAAQVEQAALGIEVVLYLRSAGEARFSSNFWRLESLDAPADAKTDLGLALAMRDFLLACPSEEFDGPYAVRAQLLHRTIQREECAKLPKWLVGGADLQRMVCNGEIIELNAEQLKLAREAIAKTDVYNFNQYMAVQVLLVPVVKEARGLWGPGRWN